MYKVILWGAGQGYNRFVSFRGYEQVQVVAIVDNRVITPKRIDGIEVISSKQLVDTKTAYDYIIVTTEEKVFKEIVLEATALGIDRKFIIPGWVFEIPFFNFAKYVEIKQANISILSNYCLAGFLYHRFGLCFASPTINMYADDEDYIRFLNNIDYYMNINMERGDDPLDKPYLGLYSVPSGKLGDVKWRFNHSISADEEIEKWNQRSKRFNRENFIAVMAIHIDEAAYAFNDLNIKYKIGFYWKDLNLKSIVYLPDWGNEKIRKSLDYSFHRYVNKIALDERGIRAINWMNVLLHEKDFIRVEF